MSLRPSVEPEVALCSDFLLVRSRAEPEGAQSLRVWSMDGTTRPARSVVPVRLGNRLSSMLIVLSSRDWSVIRVEQHKSYHLHELPSLPVRSAVDGKDAFDVPWVLLHGYRDSRVRVGRCSRSAKVQKLPASRSLSELSAHQMAPSGVIAHSRGRRALEPMRMLPSSSTVSSLYSPLGWRFRTSSIFTTLYVFVVLPSCTLSRSSLVSLFCRQFYVRYYTGRMATAVRLAFVDFIERSSIKGTVPRDGFFVLVLGEGELPGSRVHLPVSVGGRLLLHHLEKKCKVLPVSGFHLDVQCSEPVQWVPGVEYPAKSIFGLCFRGHLQTEQKGNVFHLET